MMHKRHPQIAVECLRELGGMSDFPTLEEASIMCVKPQMRLCVCQALPLPNTKCVYMYVTKCVHMCVTKYVRFLLLASFARFFKSLNQNSWILV